MGEYQDRIGKAIQVIDIMLVKDVPAGRLSEVSLVRLRRLLAELQDCEINIPYERAKEIFGV